MPLFTSKEMEPQHHQNGSAGPGNKYALLPLPSSSSPTSAFSSVFVRHRLGFLSNGIAKRLVVALFIGLACVAGLSVLLPVRSSPFCSSTQPNRFFLQCSQNDILSARWRLLSPTLHLHCASGRFVRQIPLGTFNAHILLLYIPLPSLGTTAGRVIAMVTIQNIPRRPANTFVSLAFICYTRRTIKNLEERSRERLGTRRFRCMEPSDMRTGYPESQQVESMILTVPCPLAPPASIFNLPGSMI